VATVYVNGQLVTKHDNGYTSFVVRLDNISGLVYGGGENILLIAIDASFGSEWW
jgi:beta-galactosidase/beta-glucuronidase